MVNYLYGHIYSTWSGSRDVARTIVPPTMGTRGRVSAYCCKTGLWTHFFIPRDALALLERLRAAASSAAAAIAALPALVEAGRLEAGHFGPPSTVAMSHARCWPFIEYSLVISSLVGPILETTPTGFAPVPAAAKRVQRYSDDRALGLEAFYVEDKLHRRPSGGAAERKDEFLPRGPLEAAACKRTSSLVCSSDCAEASIPKKKRKSRSAAPLRAILRRARGGWTGDPYLFPDDGKGPTGWVDKRYARPPPRARACAHPDCAGGAVWVADDDESAVPCETYGVVCAAHAICLHCNASRVLSGEEACQRCCP